MIIYDVKVDNLEAIGYAPSTVFSAAFYYAYSFYHPFTNNC